MGQRSVFLDFSKDLLQDESNRYYYARMKSLLGYPDTKYSELPQEIKEALYFALTDQVDLSPYVTVLQNPDDEPV